MEKRKFGSETRHEELHMSWVWLTATPDTAHSWLVDVSAAAKPLLEAPNTLIQSAYGIQNYEMPFSDTLAKISRLM